MREAGATKRRKKGRSNLFLQASFCFLTSHRTHQTISSAFLYDPGEHRVVLNHPRGKQGREEEGKERRREGRKEGRKEGNGQTTNQKDTKGHDIARRLLPTSHQRYWSYLPRGFSIRRANFLENVSRMPAAPHNCRFKGYNSKERHGGNSERVWLDRGWASEDRNQRNTSLDPRGFASSRDKESVSKMGRGSETDEATAPLAF